MNIMPREEFTFKFDGPAIENHEIEVSLLAESLIALRSLAERSCKIEYGTSDDLLLKVKGGFASGSFSVALILDWVNQNPAAATIGASSIMGIIAGLFKLFKWSRGKNIEWESGNDNTVRVTNNLGQINNFNANVVNLYLNARARNDAERLTRPLEQAGVDEISLSVDGEDGETVKIEKSEREFFGKKERGILREDEFALTLEIVIVNLRGEANGWRFFDGSSEFSATIEDESFLNEIKSGQRAFQIGDMLEVKMRMIQRRPAHRLKTDHSIIEVLSFIPASDVTGD